MLRNYLNGSKLFLRFSGSRYIFVFSTYMLCSGITIFIVGYSKNSMNSSYYSFPPKNYVKPHGGK